MKKETIAAIATGMTSSGIGIIRISGEESVSIVENIFRGYKNTVRLSECASHTVHYGYIYDGEEEIDEVMVVLMRAPHSYTREDSVEIDCHGGVYVMKKVLETVLKYGARPAEPGEFTKRAFLNGRIDLTQAESVVEVIQSQNEFALKNSLQQLRGKMGEQIREIRAKILHELAYIESALDDPEHFSLDGYGIQLREQILPIMDEINRILASADNGRILKEGIRTVIVGKPNAGKSSLLNMLAGEDRAIVTDVAGTTRDTLEETIYLDGLNLIIIDTAGIHETEDQVEKIGVTRARKAAEEADLILYVLDSSTKLDKDDKEILNAVKNKKVLVLFNKSDLPPVITMDEVRKETGREPIAISAYTGEGVDDLKKKISDLFFCGQIKMNDEVFLTNARQKNDLQDALHALELVMKSVDDGLPEDFYSIDLMDAYESLGRIVGESVGDDLVEEIFSKFCMGK